MFEVSFKVLAGMLLSSAVAVAVLVVFCVKTAVHVAVSELPGSKSTLFGVITVWQTGSDIVTLVRGPPPSFVSLKVYVTFV